MVVSTHTAQLSAVTDLRPPLSGIEVSRARARGVFAVFFLFVRGSYVYLLSDVGRMDMYYIT